MTITGPNGCTCGFNGDSNCPFAASAELLPLNPICPLCKREHDVGETFSGHSHECANCGALLQAADDGERMWMFVEKHPTVPPRSGRQRTRARWRKRGRR